MTKINRYTPLSGGKAVIRDLALYPETTQGESDLIAAVNAGRLPVIDAIPDAARAGTVPAPLSEARADSKGVPFTKSRVITPGAFKIRLAPRPRGNYSFLAPQQAAFTTLLSRLADVTIHPSRTVTYAGPYFQDQADRLMLAKGFTHMTEAVPNYGSLAGVGKKAINLEAAVFITSLNTANTLPDSDPRKVWLRECNITQQLLPDNEAAGLLIGNALFSLIYQADQSINGAEWVTLDIENANANPRSPNSKDAQVLNALAYIYQGMIDSAIATNSVIPKPLMYDAGGLCFLTLYYADQVENGYPSYFSTRQMNPIFLGGQLGGSVLNVNHPLAAIIKKYGGAVGVTSYQRFTWDEETMFQKKSDGSFLLDADGNPLWRTDDRRTTIFGQSVPISGNLGTNDPNPFHRTNDALWMTTFSYMRYGLLTTNMYFRAGGIHLPTNVAQAGWEKLQLLHWNRVGDTEQGGEYNTSVGVNTDFNKRPRNPDELEFDAILGYVFAPVSRGWMEHQPAISMGSDAPGDANTGKGCWEHYAKGISRAAELNFLFDTTWQLIQPRYFMRRQETAGGADPMEHYARKPVVVGGIVPNYQGKAYLWMAWRYPVQDVDQSGDLIGWGLGPDGVTPVTPGYRMVFDGRRGGVDYWQIPDAAGSVPPSRWRFQFVDMLGNKQTWTGDYRDATITAHPTPPAVLEAFTQQLTPTPTGTAPAPAPTQANGLSVSGTPAYDGSTRKLKTILAGVVGTPKFTIVGVIGNADQPSDGFYMPDNAVGTTVTIRVQTATQFIEFTQAIPAVGSTTPAASTGGNDFPTAYSWDTNTKGYNVYALIGSGSATAQMTPLDGQASPGAAMPMVAENNNIGGLVYDHKYFIKPTFAGGSVDIVAGRWKQTVVSGSQKAEAVVTLIGGQNSSGLVTAGSSGSTTPAPTSTPTPAPSPTNGPSTVVNATPLPDCFIALYSQNTHVRDFGNGPLDNSRYKNFGLQPVQNSDGVPITGLDANQRYIPPYLREFWELATAHNVTDKLGFYATNMWSDMIIGLSKTDTDWARAVLAPGWKDYVTGLFTFAHQKNMVGGLAVWPGRGNDYPEFLPDSEKGVDRAGRTSNAAVAVPAIRLFSQLLPGFDVNNIPTATSAGRFLSNIKTGYRFLRPFQQDGSLGFLMIGTHTNGEVGYDTRQDDPASSWTDFHPDEMAALQTYLKGLYNNNLGALNAAWGTQYSVWGQAELPYSGTYDDFHGQRGIDCQKFRHIRLGDTLEVMAEVAWSELPGILLMIQFGQPFGGQSEIIATMDIEYLLGRVQAVATRRGYTHRCVGVKYNPGEDENHQVRGAYMRYKADKATGGSLVMHEDTCEASTPLEQLVTDNVSKNMADAQFGAHTGRAGDMATAGIVLFSPQRWSGIDRDGRPCFQGNTVKDFLVQYWTLDRRRQAAAGIGTTDPNQTITVTIADMLRYQPPSDAAWFPMVINKWLSMGGPSRDVRFTTPGLFSS